MKLIYCKSCGDVVQVRSEESRSCFCGKSGGKYTSGAHAALYGNCIPLGFANAAFVTAITEQPATGWGKEFTAFVIAEKCETISHSDGSVA